MPAYNASRYVGAAVASILNQTFRDFELIVVNDGSSDGTLELLQSFDDPRLVIVSHENCGVSKSLNKALRMARGEYLARHDADDLSAPERLARQVDFLDANPDVGLIGAWAHVIDEDERAVGDYRHPVPNAALQFGLLFDSYLVSSSTMWRRSTQDITGPHSELAQHNPPEDFEFWSRMVRSCRVENIPEFLVTYRQLPGSLSRAKADLIRQRVVGIASENIIQAGGGRIARQEAELLAAIMHREGAQLPNKIDWTTVRQTLDFLEAALASRFPAEARAFTPSVEAARNAVEAFRTHRRVMALGQGPVPGRMALAAFRSLRHWARHLGARQR